MTTFKVYAFKPKPDITTKELAEIINANPAFHWVSEATVDQVSETTRRHFEEHKTTDQKRK